MTDGSQIYVRKYSVELPWNLHIAQRIQSHFHSPEKIKTILQEMCCSIKDTLHQISCHQPEIFLLIVPILFHHVTAHISISITSAVQQF